MSRSAGRSATTTLVHLGNFEVEQQWARDEVGLPRASSRSSAAQVNRMDELVLALAHPHDYVVCKAMPDASFLDYWRCLGLAVPTILVPADAGDPTSTVSQDAVGSPQLLAALSAIRGPDTYLMPHGVSIVEEQLALRTGLALGTPAASVCKAVNSKIYSRQVTDDAGLRQPAGWTCSSVDEFDHAVRGAAALLTEGARIGIKDAFGVSGNGILVVDNEHRLRQVQRMVSAAAHRRGTDRVCLVVEEWVATSRDLSYQFTVTAEGEVRFAHISEAMVEHGVHVGNRLPARVDDALAGQIRDCAEVIGARLAADGYHGVVGVDAMLDPAGQLYPVTEINARNTMLTYFAALANQVLAPELALLARRYPLRLSRPLSFDRLTDAFHDLLIGANGDRTIGLICHGFATVNADAPATSPGLAGVSRQPAGSTHFAGRLHAILAAPAAADLPDLDAQVRARLDAVTGEHHDGS